MKTLRACLAFTAIMALGSVVATGCAIGFGIGTAVAAAIENLSDAWKAATSTFNELRQ